VYVFGILLVHYYTDICLYTLCNAFFIADYWEHQNHLLKLRLHWKQVIFDGSRNTLLNTVRSSI